MAPTYISLNQPIVWPGNTKGIGGVPAVGNFDLSIDSNGGPGGIADATAFVFCAPQDMTITHLFARCHSVTSSPTLVGRVETVDPTTGYPTGTPWATNTTGVSGTLTTGMNTIALTAAANVTKGQMVALLYAWNGIGNFTISTAIVTPTTFWNGPYKLTNITGSWVKNGFQGAAVGVGSSATSMYCIEGFFPLSAAFAANAFNNASSAQRGARFRVPVDCYISGFRYLPLTATGDFTAAILDASSNELNSSRTSFTGKISPEQSQGAHNLYFDNEVGPLSIATDYFLAIQPLSATNCNMYTFTVANNNFRKAFPGGTDFDYATGTPTMAAIDTQVPFLDLLISRIPLGGAAGGGGGASIIGM
jgi:hypothetical protein